MGCYKTGRAPIPIWRRLRKAKQAAAQNLKYRLDALNGALIHSDHAEVAGEVARMHRDVIEVAGRPTSPTTR